MKTCDCPAGDVEAATGWSLKPEGFCRAGVCVPTPAGKEAEFVHEGAVNVSAFWRQMGRPVLHDAAGDTWMLWATVQPNVLMR